LTACAITEPSPDKPHHRDGGYRNIYNHHEPGLGAFLKWRWERLWKKIPANSSYHFPLAANDPDFLKSNRTLTTCTWIGHATVLLQLGGKNILTDPLFSERASPVQWVGPQRVVPPGIALDDLPSIDYVVISHDHYDSLDSCTVKRLCNRPDGRLTRFLVPLGFKKWFNQLGVENVTEMDWWDSADLNGLTFTAVPVQHWGKRSLFDRNNRLWVGWAIKSERFNFLFAGDSGYTPHFAEIGERLGPFDLAAIPIGAYEPRWFMKSHHLSPEEAIMVHRDIRSKKSIAIHWGTFVLTDEPLDEPPKRLEAARTNMGIPDNEFLILQHGGTIIID